eukprot:scaffold48534_cov32-Tisochrysis_lutea.AAC.3
MRPKAAASDEPARSVNGFMSSMHTSAVVLFTSCPRKASRKPRRQARETPSAGKSGSVWAWCVGIIRLTASPSAESASSSTSSFPCARRATTVPPLPSSSGCSSRPRRTTSEWSAAE